MHGGSKFKYKTHTHIPIWSGKKTKIIQYTKFATHITLEFRKNDDLWTNFRNWADCAEHIKIYRDKNAISNGKVGKISIMSNNSMIF